MGESRINNGEFSKILETLYSSCMQSLKHSIYIYRLLVYSYLYTIYSDSEIILTSWSMIIKSAEALRSVSMNMESLVFVVRKNLVVQDSQVAG